MTNSTTATIMNQNEFLDAGNKETFSAEMIYNDKFYIIFHRKWNPKPENILRCLLNGNDIKFPVEIKKLIHGSN